MVRIGQGDPDGPRLWMLELDGKRTDWWMRWWAKMVSGQGFLFPGQIAGSKAMQCRGRIKTLAEGKVQVQAARNQQVTIFLS